MRAMVLSNWAAIAKSPLGSRDVEVPEPRPGEVRVRTLTCGLCRTDLHVIEGELPPHKRDVIPGHQIVGVVDKLGAGAARFTVGDRVGIAWLRSTRGECRYCRAGKENLCPNALFTGYDADGGYAEFAVVRPDRSMARWAGGHGLSAPSQEHGCEVRDAGAARTCEATVTRSSARPVRPHCRCGPVKDVVDVVPQHQLDVGVDPAIGGECQRLVHVGPHAWWREPTPSTSSGLTSSRAVSGIGL